MSALNTLWNVKLTRKKSFLGNIGTTKHKRFDRLRHALRKLLQTTVPSVYFLAFKAKKDEFIRLRRVISFPVGLLTGYLMHTVILQKFDFSPRLNSLLMTFTTVFIGMAYTMSVQVRAITWLTIPTFLGRISRSYLMAATFAVLLSGPIGNIVYNTYDSVRVVGCTFALNWNHTAAKYKLIFKPIKDIILTFGKSTPNITKKAKKIQEKFLPFKQEVEDQSGVERAAKNIDYVDEKEQSGSRVAKIEDSFKHLLDSGVVKTQAEYNRKVEYRCENVFSLGAKGCILAFKDAEERCYRALKVVGYLICWPMKLSVICKLLSNLAGSRTCDAVPMMSPNFGEGFEAAQESVKEFRENFDAQLQYKLEVPDEPLEMTSPKDIQKALKRKFDQKVRLFAWINELFGRYMVIIFLAVVLKANNYHSFYLTKIYFDNIYITAYFRHIDARRHLKGRMCLLPPKRVEKLELVDVLDLKLGPEEKKKAKSSLLILVPLAISALVVSYLDYLFAFTLEQLRQSAYIQFEQSGVHKIKMKVFGNGTMAKLVRHIVKDFSHAESLDSQTTSEQCLPKPKVTETSTRVVVLALFLVCILFNYAEAYFLRLRRVICSFFYPWREKKRVLYLYNDRIKKRKRYLKYMAHRVRKMVRHKTLLKDVGFLESLAHGTKYFAFLKKFWLARRTCILCEERENDSFHWCQSKTCGIIYCENCWNAARRRCHACEPVQSDDTDLSDDDDV